MKNILIESIKQCSIRKIRTQILFTFVRSMKSCCNCFQQKSLSSWSLSTDRWRTNQMPTPTVFKSRKFGKEARALSVNNPQNASRRLQHKSHLEELLPRCLAYFHESHWSFFFVVVEIVLICLPSRFKYGGVQDPSVSRKQQCRAFKSSNKKVSVRPTLHGFLMMFVIICD